MQFVQTVAPPQALHARTGLEHGWRAAPFHREGRKTLSSRNLLAAYLVARAACRTDFGHRVRRSSSGSTNIAEEPLFRFGLIADVQYANRDDALNFSGSRLRRYRNSRTLWDRAVKWFRDEKVDFIAQLGDFVDGCNQDLPGGGRKALQELLGPVDQGPPVLHLIGNHELYNFARKEMEDGIPLPGLKVPFRTSAPPALDAEAPSKTSSYYSFSPADGWRVCVLDPYEISIMSHGGGRPGVDEVTLEPGAVSWCQENNPNDITKEDFARGIPPGEARRWVPLNGAVSEQQLIWLEETLELASKKNEETIILSHVVLLPEATPGQNGLTLLWNYDKVLQVLRSAERPPTAVLCGHAHLMVNSRDQVSGTHHVTLPTPVEANPGSDACAVVEAFSNGLLKIRGRGDVLSSTLACSTHEWCCDSWCYVNEACPIAKKSWLGIGFYFSYETCDDPATTYNEQTDSCDPLRRLSARRRFGGGGGWSFGGSRRRRSPWAASTSARRRSWSAPSTVSQRRRAPPPPAVRRRVPPPVPSPMAGRRRSSSLNGQSFSTTPRRRATSSVEASLRRRRTIPETTYGYANRPHMMNNYGGTMPYQTPYGYTGYNAIPQQSSPNVAMYGAAGFAGGLGAAYMYNSMYSDSWGMHRRRRYGDFHNQNFCIVTDPGSRNGAFMACEQCYHLYGFSSCPSADSCRTATGCRYTTPQSYSRDELAATGFIPQAYTPPLKVIFTSITGQGIDTTSICPPLTFADVALAERFNRTMSFKPELFLVLSRQDVVEAAEQTGAATGFAPSAVLLLMLVLPHLHK